MTTASSATPSAATAPNLLLWINRGLEGLWLLTVILVPLAFLERGYAMSEAVVAYVEVPKIALLRLLVGLMAALWLVEWAIAGRFPLAQFGGPAGGWNPSAWPTRLASWLRDQPTRWGYLAVWFFLATTLLGTVLSASFSVSLWGEVPGQDGYPAYTIVAYVLLFAVIATHLKTRPQLWRLVGAIVVMGVLIGGYGVLQRYGHDFLGLMEPPGANRVTSTMGNAVFAAAAMLMPIGVSLMAATITLPEPLRSGAPRQRAGQWVLVLAVVALWVLVLAVQLLGITFTFSRGPWLGTLLALASFLGLTTIFAGWGALGRAALVLGLASAVAFAALPGTGPMFPLSLAAGLIGLAAVFVIGWRNVGKLALAGGLAVTLYASVFLMPSWFSEGGGAAGSSSQVAQRFASIQGDVASGLFNERGRIWQGSWQLIRDHPWFAFDSLSLHWLRPVIGYGPDLFRYTYLQVSPPGYALVPLEPDHGHNYFIHQTVELGFLGLLGALGIFAAPFLVGGYQLLKQRQGYSQAHKLVLIGLLATLAGRLLEQMVGVARVSDLTIFWALLAMFAALPVAMQSPEPVAAPDAQPARQGPSRSRRSRPSRSRGSGPSRRSESQPYNQYGRKALRPYQFWRLAVVAWLIGGIIALTWVKSVNYPRAAVEVGEGVEHFRRGNLQATLADFERAIALAPDVPSYYSYRASVYSAYAEFQDDPRVPREPECDLQPQGVPYEACLAQKAYFSNQQGAAQRPFYWRTRSALADSAFKLTQLEDEAIRIYQEVIDLVPASWPLHNHLAIAYLEAGRPDEALEPLQKSLEITGGRRESANARFLLGVAYRDLGEPEKALEALTLSLQLESSGSSARLAHQVLADVYTSLGQPELAQEHQERYEEMEAALQ